MRNSLPCKYEDYQGSRWYSRLIFDEFHIQFDQYPKKEIIIDKIAEQKLENKDKLNLWYSTIRKFWISKRKEWNNFSPYEFINTLRNKRKELFDLYYFDYKPSAFLNTMNINTLESNKFYNVILDGSDYKNFEAQISLFKKSCNSQFKFFISKDFKDYCKIKDISLLEIPGEIEFSYSFQNSNIICCDIWYAFVLRNNNIAFTSFLDRREWFSNLILKDSQIIGKNLVIPKNIKYNNILKDLEHCDVMRKLFYVSSNYQSLTNGAFFNSPTIRNKDTWFDKIIKNKDIKELTGFFLRENNDWTKCDLKCDNIEKKFISFFAIKKDELKISPTFFNKMTSPLSLKFEKGGFFTSFNYYFTDNLKKWYSKIDDTPLSWENFLIDYIYLSDEKYETIPLYNKTLLGCTKDGELFNQESEWEEIILKIGNTQFTFNSKCLDLENNAQIYFPTNKKNKITEDGSIFISIVQDYVWKIELDSAFIPPFGVLIKVKDFIITDNDVNIEWKVKWLNYKFKKEQWDWLIGGFNSIIRDGIDLMENSELANKQLLKEGWKNSSSLLTQETQLLEDVKQPRSFIGKAGEYIILGSIAGRFPFSKGATFSDESSFSKFALNYLNIDNKIEFLINLDGGASSLLGVNKENENPILIVPPSASATNCAGIPRMVPSTLKLEFI